MAEPPIGKALDLSIATLELTNYSPRWRDRLPQSRLCGAGKQWNTIAYPAHAAGTDGACDHHRTSPITNSLPSLADLSSDRKSALGILSSRISCAGMKLRLRGRCYRSHTLCVASRGMLVTRRVLTNACLDGERHSKEMGRYAAPLGFHF